MGANTSQEDLSEAQQLESANITTLDYSNKKLKTLQTFKFSDAAFKTLLSLNISGNELQSLEGLAKAIALEDLNVHGNPLRSVGDELFVLNNLKKLVLKGCLLTELSPKICNLTR